MISQIRTSGEGDHKGRPYEIGTGGGEDQFPPTVFARVGSPRDDGDGDGSPPSRGQREGERINSRLPSSRGQVLRGMMGTGMGPRLREDNGRGAGMDSRLLSSREQDLRGMMGTGMGPRLREDNGRGAGMNSRLLSSRGQDLRGGMGWVPAFARTTGGGEDGFPHPSLREQDLRGGMGTGMGPRLREDNGRGRGWVPAPVSTRAGSSRDDGDGDGSPPSRGQREGRGDEFPPTVFARAGSPRDDGGARGGEDEFPPVFARGIFAGWGWVPAWRGGDAPSRGQREGERMNSRLLSSRGQVLRGMMGTGMGPRLREDNGRGRGVRGGGVPSPGKTLSWQPLPFSSRGSQCNPLLAGRSGRRRAPRWPRRIRLRTS